MKISLDSDVSADDCPSTPYRSDSESCGELKRKTLSSDSESEYDPKEDLNVKVWIKPAKVRKVVVSRRGSITDVAFDSVQAPVTPSTLVKKPVVFFGVGGLPQFYCTLPDNWITRGYNYSLPHTLEQVEAIRRKPEIQFND
jgi:hypothetical protein